jgi:hypothetical protein
MVLLPILVLQGDARWVICGLGFQLEQTFELGNLLGHCKVVEVSHSASSKQGHAVRRKSANHIIGHAGNPIVHDHVEPELSSSSAQTSASIMQKCPFFLDEAFSAPTAAHRAARLEGTTAVWAAYKDCSIKATGRHRHDSTLIPADRMWLDVTSGRQMMEAFPARQYLGRYRS